MNESKGNDVNNDPEAENKRDSPRAGQSNY